MTRPLRGLYAVTPDTENTSGLLKAVEAVVSVGACALQYRNKRASPELRQAQARALSAICRAHGVPLIINDHLDLALQIDADGLHLGDADGSVSQARSRLGPGKLLGVSCYNRLELAIDAARLGADYVAFGSFFASGSKPAAVRAPITLLREARQRLGLPLIAIGGITVENASRLFAEGADAVAVIGALFDSPDPGAAATRFAAIVSSGIGEAPPRERLAN